MRNVLLIVCGMLLMALIQAAPQLSLESLDARVTVLEKRVLGDGPAAPPAAADDWVMYVEKIELLAPDPDKLAQAAKLRTDADEADKKATKLEDDASKIVEATGKGVKRPTPREQVLDRAKESRDRAKDLRTQAARLEKDASSPRHKIIGWNGQRTATLLTDRDMTTQLSRVSIGSYITWKGKRISMTGIEENFSLSSFDRCEPPAGFRVRPK